MKQSTVPILVILLLGLTAALYFVFQSPSSSGAGDFSGAAVAEEMESAVQSESATGVLPEVESAVTREDVLADSLAASGKEIAPIEVTVVSPSGVGIEGARVFSWQGEELQEEVLTNAEGKVTLLGLAGDGGLMALAPQFLPVILSQHFNGTAITVQVDPGESLGGRVTFKRPRIDTTPMVIRVISVPFPASESLPIVVANLLKEIDVRPGFTDALVDDFGHFRISGLPKRWAGRIRLPRGFFIFSYEGPGKSNGSDFIELPQTSTHLAIELLELPVFTGRIVASDGITGIAANLMVRPYMTAARNNTTMMGGRADEAGFFRIHRSSMGSDDLENWLKNPDSAFQSPVTVAVDVFATDEHAGTSEILEVGMKTNPWDLGVIAVKNLATQPILVVDSKGQPIEGAHAFATRLSEPTDADGFTEVLLGEDVETVAVGAFGFQSAAASLPESRDERLKVVLEAAVQLHVTWNVPEDFDMSDLDFRLESEGELLLNEGTSWLFNEMRFQRLAGLDFSGGGGNQSKGRHMEWHLGPSQSEFSIWGLKPGIPIKAMVVDPMRNELASSTSMIFSAGETREIEFHFTNLPKPFVGKVVDRSGSPVSGVRLIASGSQGSARAHSNVDGEFTFKSILGPVIKLSASKDGYANWRDDEYALPMNGGQAEIMLEEGREMAIYFRDESGATYTDVYLASPGKGNGEGISDDGGFLLKALPQSTFTLHWQCGGAIGDTWIPEGVQEYVIEIPAMASVYFKATRVNAEERESVHLTFVPMNASAQDPEDSFFERSLSLKAGVRSLDEEYPVLLPGEYMVKYSTWCKTDGKWGDQPLGEQGPFTVLAGQVLQLSIDF